MGCTMQSDVSAVLEMLARIRVGGDVTVDEVKALSWNTASELKPLVQRIYRELIMFADDTDIRSGDRAYDWSKRSTLNEYYEELKARVGASGR
jgi:hypothetical protein